MSLSIKSNQMSSIALRSMQAADAAMSRSLSKLASGSRVQSARDDAAALAIGSRLKAELAALKTVSTNATQGISMLQIAEGAYARANDMVIRMRALASQAASSQLSATERGMLDTEFQALKSELNRMAGATTFNGQQLVNASVTWQYNSIPANFSNYIADFTFYGLTNAGAFADWNGEAQAGRVSFLHSLTGKYYAFDYSNALTAATVTRDISVAIYELSSYAGTPVATAGSITIRQGATDIGNGLGSIVINDFIAAFRNNTVSATAQSVKVSTGSSNNSISAGLFGITAQNLGLSYAKLTSQNSADAAATAAQIAIDLIARARSEVGAAQNRMSAAENNNATMIENFDTARSAYLDLDIADEMSVFTSKQILVQAGISMIAQANQMPQNLLRLFNGGLL